MNITGARSHQLHPSPIWNGSLEFYHGLLGFEVLNVRPHITSQYFREIVDFPEGVIKGAYLAIPGHQPQTGALRVRQPARHAAGYAQQQPRQLAPGVLRGRPRRGVYEELKSKGVRFRSAPVYMDEGPSKGGWGPLHAGPPTASRSSSISPRTELRSRGCLGSRGATQ